jgi:polyisoprenoid-binding protein YceI
VNAVTEPEPGQPAAHAMTLARNGELAGQWKLDPQASQAEFRVRHFWHAITVRGSFTEISGEGTVGPDGTASGTLVIAAASLTTNNKQRDKHLRSADFFDAGNHPRVTVTVRQATPGAGGQLTAEGTLEAAGTAEPVTFTAEIIEASPDAVTLRASLTIDRSRFGMTWSPLRMAAMDATGIVTARFTRQPADS